MHGGRRARSHGQGAGADQPPEAASDSTAGRPQWAIGFTLLLLWIASYVALREDGLHGSHAAWPIYLFFIVVIVCAIFWGYLVASNI